MSSSQHPVALTVERRVGGATKLLATIMCLPLVDGIFPALVLAGALGDPVGILEVGLLIFGGSATVAVVLAEMDGSRREVATAILAVGAVLIPVAAVEAALAPTIRDMLNMPVFSRFAGLVILTVAAKTASARVGEYLPRPAIVIALGLVASFDPSGVSLSVTTDPELIGRAVAAAGVGVGFALLVALLGPWLRAVVDIDRFRFGSAVALGVLPLSIFGLVPGDAPIALAVLGVTALFAFDPDGDREYDGVPGDVSDDAAVADGGDPEDADASEADADEDESVPGRVSDYVTTDDERAPWL
ncbi:DUF5794 domain-containing protein [Halosimplex pelagicum]|uniref:Uncharacterized protein n=1 Tax=Halosimplex pelagicum TaxID=869886 RepID=A0A7D5PG34_9EURY|nr:DUF5794 domain-containing protein [Halosimplex pelagicum]QLH83379.1 hypothetical protein HZS54_17840 [Halosimplex pelagicum]